VIRAGEVIALCVLALLTLGVVMVNSADMTVAAVDAGTTTAGAVTFQSIALSRSTAYMALALAAMGIAALLPVRRLAMLAEGAGGGSRAGGTERADHGMRDAILLWIGACGLIGLLLLVYAPVIGHEVNGSHRWIRLPIPGLGDALSAQPSELAKWGLVGLLSWYGARRAAVGANGAMHKFWASLVPALIAVGMVSIVIVVEDLGTGVLVAAVAALVLLAAGARLWQFLMFVPPALGGVAFAILSSDYRMARVMAFLDPYRDPEKTGYHMIQSMLAVAGGEGPGRGLGHGLQKFGYLPEDRTDFLAAVLFEELGIAGAAIVTGLFVALIWACFAVVRNERSLCLKLFTLGVVCTVGLQAIINLAVVTGLGPTKGIALPLVSSGGTGWILTAFCLGLVIAVARTQQREPQPHPGNDTLMARSAA
jgi:cell division protein FtsW